MRLSQRCSCLHQSWRGNLIFESGLARGQERHFRTGKRADNLDTTLFQLPVFALPFSPSSSGRHFAGFPVVIKTPRICINCALINEIMLFRNQVPFFVLLGKFVKIYLLLSGIHNKCSSATFILDSQKETQSSASDLRF